MALGRIASIVLVMGLLSGCATNWYRPTKTQAEFQQDKYVCDYNATLYSNASHGYYNFITAGMNFGDSIVTSSRFRVARSMCVTSVSKLLPRLAGFAMPSLWSLYCQDFHFHAL